MRKQFVAALAITVLWQAGAFANQHFVTDTGQREAWAAQYENEGVYFSTAGLRSETLVVNVYPPDAAGCSASLDTIAADSKFVDDISAMGFNFVECLSYDERDHVTGMEIRKLVQRKSAQPFKPLHPNLRANA